MTPPSIPLHPLLIQKIGHELAIAWSDGVETFFSLPLLRQACPCAKCQGEPELIQHASFRNSPLTTTASHPASLDTLSYELKTYETVGGYGLQLQWGDGHRTGIYAYAYLRRLASETIQAPSPF